MGKPETVRERGAAGIPLSLLRRWTELRMQVPGSAPPKWGRRLADGGEKAGRNLRLSAWRHATPTGFNAMGGALVA